MITVATLTRQPYPSQRADSHKLIFYRMKVLGFRQVKATVNCLKIMMFLQILHVIKQQVQIYTLFNQ